MNKFPNNVWNENKMVDENNGDDGVALTSISHPNTYNERLTSLVHRIEQLEEERKTLASDIKDIYTEANSAGFDKKVLRMLIAERKKDAAEVEEQMTLLDIYRRQVGAG